MGAKSLKYMSFSIGLFFLGLLGNLMVKGGNAGGPIISGYMPQLALIIGLIILIIGLFIKEEKQVASKSQKYITFAIGIIFFGFLNCFICKFEGGLGDGFAGELMVMYIPLAAIIVGLVFLIKGLITKD